MIAGGGGCGGLCLQFSQQVVQYVTVAHQLQSAVGIVEQGISAGVVENIESPLCIYVQTLGQYRGDSGSLAPKYLVSHRIPPSFASQFRNACSTFHATPSMLSACSVS